MSKTVRIALALALLSILAAGVFLLARPAKPSAPPPRKARQKLLERLPTVPPGEVSEGELKAAMILKIGEYVEWSAAPAAPGTPFVVGVLGDSAVGDHLVALGPKTLKDGRSLKVLRVDDPLGTGPCHVVFIPEGWKDDWDLVLKDLGRAGLLLVGEEPGFLGAGGMIELRVRDRRLRFALDPGRAERSGLKFVPQLVTLSESP